MKTRFFFKGKAKLSIFVDVITLNINSLVKTRENIRYFRPGSITNNNATNWKRHSDYHEYRVIYWFELVSKMILNNFSEFENSLGLKQYLVFYIFMPIRKCNEHVRTFWYTYISALSYFELSWDILVPIRALIVCVHAHRAYVWTQNRKIRYLYYWYVMGCFVYVRFNGHSSKITIKKYEAFYEQIFT